MKYERIKRTLEGGVVDLPATLNRLEETYMRGDINLAELEDLKNVAKDKAAGFSTGNASARLDALEAKIAVLTDKVDELLSKSEGYEVPKLKDPRGLMKYEDKTSAVHGEDYLIGDKVYKCTPEYKQEVNYGPATLPECWTDVTDEYDMTLIG